MLGKSNNFCQVKITFILYSTFHKHITLQPKTGYPLKLSRVEPGQYLDGRPGETRFLLGYAVYAVQRVVPKQVFENCL